MEMETRTDQMKVHRRGLVKIHEDITVTRVRPDKRTLTERIHEAYSDKLEPKERRLLDRAAEQFGRRLSSEE